MTSVRITIGSHRPYVEIQVLDDKLDCFALLEKMGYQDQSCHQALELSWNLSITVLLQMKRNLSVCITFSTVIRSLIYGNTK